MHLVVPSERNFEVYHAVEIELMSRRTAATRFGISSTRVQQIVAQVKEFVREHGDDAIVQAAPERLELASLNVCHEKLNYFYKSTMRLWNQVRDQPAAAAGSVRLLHSAARLSIEQTKVVARIAKVRLAMIEEGTLERVDPAQLTIVREDDNEEATPATSPPSGGCTAPKTQTQPSLIEQALARRVNPSEDFACDQTLAAMLSRHETKGREKHPAHSGGKPRGSAA